MLTDEEIIDMAANELPLNSHYKIGIIGFARAIEREVLKKLVEQEPVAEVQSKYGDPEAFGERHLHVIVDLNNFKYDTKLYAHPLPAQAVPEKMQYSDDDDGDFSHSYVNGYNDAIDAMLSASPKP